MMLGPPATPEHATTPLRPGCPLRHHARTLIRLPMAFAILCLLVSCTPAPQAPGPDEFAGPVCIAYDNAKRKVQCDAQPDAFSGDNCTCVDSITGDTYLGRVHGGL